MAYNPYSGFGGYNPYSSMRGMAGSPYGGGYGSPYGFPGAGYTAFKISEKPLRETPLDPGSGFFTPPPSRGPVFPGSGPAGTGGTLPGEVEPPDITPPKTSLPDLGFGGDPLGSLAGMLPYALTRLPTYTPEEDASEQLMRQLEGLRLMALQRYRR